MKAAKPPTRNAADVEKAVVAPTTVNRPERTNSTLQILRKQRTGEAEKHIEEVRKADVTRWMVIIIAAVLSSLLSFVIDQFTWIFGIWRSSLTHNGQSLVLVVAINVFAVCVARLINRTTLESEGSGFPEMKAMLFGKVMLNFLTLRVLFCKATSLALGVGAGLPLGKEGPNVHLAACISRSLKPEFYEPESASLQGKHVKNTKVVYLLLAACSVGVGASFAAPIGGVIFAMELMLPQVYDAVSYWGCFVSSVAGSFAYTLMRTASSGASTLEPLISSNVERGEGATTSRPVTCLLVNLLLGAICGLMGGLWVQAHAKVGGYMKRWRQRGNTPQEMPDSPKRHGSLVRMLAADGDTGFKASLRKSCSQWRDLAQVIVVVTLNTVLAAQLPLLGGKPQPQLLSSLFDKTLIAQNDWALPAVGTLGTLFLCYCMKFSTTILSLCLPISAGVVAPVMIIGALIGRMYGQLMPDWFLEFLLSAPGQITPVTDAEKGALLARFAITGAAAHATAVTRAFAMAITVYEVLTLPSSLLPLCTSCLAAIFVANKVSPPFFDMNLIGRGLGGISALTHTDHANKSALCVMRHLNDKADCLSEYTSKADIRRVLSQSDDEVQHFAILQNVLCRNHDGGVASMLKGSITRKALKKIEKQSPETGEIHILAAEFVLPQGDEEPPVCLNPQHVNPEAFVRDIYIILKASESEIVYVIGGNVVLGAIDYKALLGHDLEKPWFPVS